MTCNRGLGGSRRPGAIFPLGNRDGDIAIHPFGNEVKALYAVFFGSLGAVPVSPGFEPDNFSTT